MTAAAPDRRREALRQQMLLRALWRDAHPAVVQGWLRGGPDRTRRGLQAYQANAGALAERALAAAFPTVAQLLGAEALAALARVHWHRDPPLHGDVSLWGAGLADFIATDPQLADEPYLADVARLDRAVHDAGSAADDDAPPLGLQSLADHDPARLQLRLRAGHAVLLSVHPLHAIWAAHQRSDDQRFADVRLALAEGRQEAVRVRRHGLQVVVERITQADARFELALLQGASLAQAMADALATASHPSGFDFEDWLITTLRRGGLAAVLRHPSGDPLP